MSSIRAMSGPMMLAWVALMGLMLTGCTQAKTANLPLTAEQQQALTPDEVLDYLMAGNARYVAGKVSDPNVKASVAASASGQYPKAVILSCLDSRVPVEKVFDQGIGDIFVGRVAGNVENEDQLGSMEFAAAAAGVKLVMVLGHTACGAVKGACDDVQLGNLTALLSKIKPAVEAVPGHDGNRTSKNAAFVDAVVHKNVVMTVADIRSRSSVLAEMEREGRIKIVGGVYDLATGKVTLLHDTKLAMSDDAPHADHVASPEQVMVAGPEMKPDPTKSACWGGCD